jgi:hypothetical protein
MTSTLRAVSMEPFRAPSFAQWAFEKLREYPLRVLITTPHHDATNRLLVTDPFSEHNLK